MVSTTSINNNVVLTRGSLHAKIPHLKRENQAVFEGNHLEAKKMSTKRYDSSLRPKQFCLN